MILRPYQHEAVQAVYAYLRAHDDNPCVVLPTAAGKTPVIATLCRDAVTLWGGRVLILAHVKELLEQAVEKLHLVAPELWHQVGVYSAGLGKRDTEHAIIVGGIQSVYKRADTLGHFDLVIIDEAHMVPADGEGMYRTLLTDLLAINSNLRVIGLTATPFRLSSGPICAPENMLNSICYEIGVRELIVKGFLCPLISKNSETKINTDGLHTRAGEFVADEVERVMTTGNVVEDACIEIIRKTRDRHSVLIFTSGVKHGRHVAGVLKDAGQSVESVFGDTLAFVRDQVLTDFKNQKIKYLVNVNVLTTGFDAPNIDCVVMLRPTLSPGLYYQCLGRGFRLHESKQNCLVLDFGGNILRHGPVDCLKPYKPYSGDGEAPAKECPRCHSVVAAGVAKCPDCGFVFPPREYPKHTCSASDEEVLSGKVTVTKHAVTETGYTVHRKRGAPENAPRSMRVDYRIGLGEYQSEWICFEHGGYARAKAEAWWKRRCHLRVPIDTEDAVELARDGVLASTSGITVRQVSGEDFPRITDYELGPKLNVCQLEEIIGAREPGDDDLEPVPASCNEPDSDEEVPF